MRKYIISYFISVISMIQVARAADIGFFENAAGNGIDVILLSGEIQKGDYSDFIGMLRPNHKGLVILSSPGGSLQEGLRIGTEIRLRGYATSVMADKGCYSACALIWLAGSSRLMTTTSKIGFHAAYNISDGVASEVGSGNAEVGSYLTRLGYNIEAIRYFTTAPPEKLLYLDFAVAEALDIEVTDSASLPIIPKGSSTNLSSSFDCAKAATLDELTICSNEQLGELDKNLAKLYGERLGSSTSYSLKSIKREQRLWLEHRRSCQDNVACLTDAYISRLTQLSLQTSQTNTTNQASSSPSFSCLKARLEDELAICANGSLAKKDGSVDTIFRGRLKTSDKLAQDALKEEQRAWLRNRQKCKSDLDCLNRQYDARIKALSE